MKHQVMEIIMPLKPLFVAKKEALNIFGGQISF